MAVVMVVVFGLIKKKKKHQSSFFIHPLNAKKKIPNPGFHRDKEQ